MDEKRVDKAFQLAPREMFLPHDVRQYALVDRPIGIGHGQTNSQPSLVRRMLKWLDPKPGDNVLDVGSGSGWTSALLGRLVEPNGSVHAVERIPELVAIGQHNATDSGVKNVSFHQAGDTFGLPEHAPYDCILVSASTDELPPELIDQLRTGGRIVIPVGHDIVIASKSKDGLLKTDRHTGFLFVPLVRNDNV